MSTNGNLALTELVEVQSQGYVLLSVRTAAAWNLAKAAAAKQRVILSIALPVGGYRTWAIQLDMRAHPKNYNITPGIVPGLPSQHGWGTCVDVASGQAWMIDHGAEFGFHRTQLAIKDYNHFQHDGSATAGSGSTPITEEDFLMTLSDYDQQLVRNAVVDINNRTDAMQKAIADLSKHLIETRPELGFALDAVLASQVPAILSATTKASSPVTLSDSDVARIAAAIKNPPIDYAAIAAAVNTDAAKRLAE